MDILTRTSRYQILYEHLRTASASRETKLIIIFQDTQLNRELIEYRRKLTKNAWCLVWLEDHQD